MPANVVSVVCRMRLGSARRSFVAGSVSDLLPQLDDFVRGERIEYPDGVYELVFIRDAGRFSVGPFDDLPSRALRDWERHIIEMLLNDAMELVRDVDDDYEHDGYPDSREEKEPWQ